QKLDGAQTPTGADDGEGSGPGSDPTLKAARNYRPQYGACGWVVDGTPQADDLHLEGDRAEIRGYAANDTIWGTSGDDCMYGGAGNDVVNTSSGNDLENGGVGNDRLLGGPGNDQLYGGGGADVLSGGDGDDLLVGGVAADFGTVSLEVKVISLG